MIIRKIVLFIALIIPITMLAILTYMKHERLQRGVKIILPIYGFDPRDLLSGHYLIYRVQYGLTTEPPCKYYAPKGATVYMCLKKYQKTWSGYLLFSENQAKKCDAYIKGVCRYSHFTAGIEKYYIPEEWAKPLEQVVRDQRGSIVLIVKNGEAAIKELLIDDKKWQDFIKQ